jgi:large subunit ribosomal protein L32
MRSQEKISKARRDKRPFPTGSSYANLVACPKCGELRMPHRACRNCGTYNNRTVLKTEA